MNFSLANFCRTLQFNCFLLLIKFICQDFLRELYLKALFVIVDESCHRFRTALLVLLRKALKYITG